MGERGGGVGGVVGGLGFEEAMLLALKVDEGTTSQGVQVASGSWAKQGNGFSIRNSALLRA